MTAEGRCPRCDTPLPPGGEGKECCRRCLLALGLSAGLLTDPGAGAEARNGTAPGGYVGPYRILDPLGAGRLGEVYLAEPRSAGGTRVALRVAGSGVDAGAALARLEAARRAFTGTSDPGVAKVLEAGRTGDGRVWLAMEWVRGVPLTEHCDRERLSTPLRLGLFVEACACVQRAHERGVLHGSLKPSSVLVAGGGDGTTLRVTDLGVAPALDQALTGEALGTAQGLLTASPAYWSPEQLDPKRGVDERSDVYSLGVLLYELLAGAPPFEPRTLRRARWADVVRTVREEVPRAPSRRLRALDETLAAEVASARGCGVGALVAGLRGDLDAICMKALEKDPDRRYPTPAGLGLDLRRHLDGEPVCAAPRGLWPRLRRGWRLRRSSKSSSRRPV